MKDADATTQKAAEREARNRCKVQHPRGESLSETAERTAERTADTAEMVSASCQRMRFGEADFIEGQLIKQVWSFQGGF